MSGDWGWVDGAQSLSSVGATGSASANVTITVPGAANTKGAWAEVSASAPFAAAGVFFNHEFSASTGIVNGLVDIGVGASGSEQVLVPDIPVQRYSSDLGWASGVFIPCQIPSGARLAMRYASSDVAGAPVLQASMTLVPQAHSYPISAGRVVAYGADSANSRGTVVDPGATANTKGAWAQLVASTSIKSRWLLLSMLGHTTKNNYRRYRLDLGIGASGSEVQVLTDLFHYTGSGPGGGIRFFLPLALPAGVRLAARCQTDTTTSGARELVVIAHAMG